MKKTEILAEINRIRRSCDALERAILPLSMATTTPRKRAVPDYSEALADIMTWTAACFHYSIEDIMGKRQFAHLVSARSAFAVAARGLGINYNAIGKFLDRHHTSIVSLVKDYETRLENYTEHKTAMLAVVNKFKP